MITSKRIPTTPLAALAALLALGTAKAATTIYNETFSGSTGTPLVGTATPSGNNWLGDANNRFTQAGTVTGSTGQGSAYLPFTLTQGLIYTLQVDLDPTSGTNWMSTGFSVGAGDGSLRAHANSGATTYGWMLVRGNDGFQTFAGPSTGGGESGTSGVGNTVTLVLDTTNASNYTVAFFFEGTSVRTPVASIGTPSLSHVFIDFNAPGASSTVDNFSL